MKVYIVHIVFSQCDWTKSEGEWNEHKVFSNQDDAVDLFTRLRQEVYIDDHPQSYGVSEVYKDEPSNFYFRNRNDDCSVRFYITENEIATLV